jgi:hypothetical protein
MWSLPEVKIFGIGPISLLSAGVWRKLSTPRWPFSKRYKYYSSLIRFKACIFICCHGIFGYTSASTQPTDNSNFSNRFQFRSKLSWAGFSNFDARRFGNRSQFIGMSLSCTRICWRTLLTFLRQLAYTSIQRYGGLFAPFFGNICRKLFSSLRFALKGHYGMDKTW